MKTSVVSLTKTLYDGEAIACTLPTAIGEITILPKHRPLISILTAGTARITEPSGSVVKLQITSGFLEVGPDHTVHILID